MGSVRNINRKAGVCIVFLLVFVLSCANQGDEGQSVETGSASFTVDWYDDATVQSTDTVLISTQPAYKSLASTRSEDRVSIAQTGANICEDVTEISCEVYDASGRDLASASFACSAHTGAVENIPAGSNREFVILGVNTAGDIVYQGRKSNVTIIPDQTNNVGTIDAHPFYVSTLLNPLNGAQVNPGGFSLTWEPVENASEYRIQISGQIGFDTLVVDITTTGTSYQPANLSSTGIYYWRVFPIDNHSNQGAPSEEVRQFTITGGTQSCTYGLSSSSASFSAEGGSGNVTVTTSGGSCQWSVSSNAVWLSITSGSSFTGSGTLTYTVSENIAAVSRTAALTITGDGYTATHSVTQSIPGVVTITSPTSGESYSTTAGLLNIEGSASNNTGITRVTWANNRGGSGTCGGTTSWGASGITLYEGENVITVTAMNDTSLVGIDTLTVTYISDAQEPVVTITSPTSGAGYNTAADSLSIGGSASDNAGITRVTWTNDRGGSGTCTGTTSWTVSGITLYEGTNVITVTAADTAGNTAVDTLTVTRLEDESPPTLSFLSPTTGGGYDTTQSSLSISGAASDDVGISQVTWRSSRGGAGTCTGTTSWSASGIELYEGTNIITVTAYDTGGNTSRAILPVGYTPVGELPTVTISTPSSNETYSTQNSTLSIGGSASDDDGVIQVTWTNDRGGSGACNGTTTWSASGITLFSGDNVITATARDAAGETGSDTLTVTYTPSETIPAVIINYPTTSDSYTILQSTLSIGGTASDDEGVTQVLWINDRGGSGICEGTSNWSASITLTFGTNLITVSAFDAAGNVGLDILTVIYGEGVYFPDSNLEAAIREKIGKPTGAITTTDLEGMTSLNAGGEGPSIGNLEGLQYCTDLTYLEISGGDISDLSPLAGLTSLTSLYLWDNQISDISPLSGLTYLTEIDLYNNQISTISPLTGLTNLSALYLGNNQISDISPLSGLTYLTEIDLTGNQIINISPLEGLTNLIYLFLDSNQIIDISPLADNTGINSADLVDLSLNPLSETSCFQLIPELQGRGVTVYHDCSGGE